MTFHTQRFCRWEIEDELAMLDQPAAVAYAGESGVYPTMRMVERILLVLGGIRPFRPRRRMLSSFRKGGNPANLHRNPRLTALTKADSLGAKPL
jgi:hypothetical protein